MPRPCFRVEFLLFILGTGTERINVANLAYLKEEWKFASLGLGIHNIIFIENKNEEKIQDLKIQSWKL